MRIFLIVLSVIATAVGIFFLGIWQKWWKNPFAMPDGNGSNDGTPTNGGTPGNSGAPDAAPPTGSVLVNVSDISTAPNPSDTSLSSHAMFFNKATISSSRIIPLIHYVNPGYAPLAYIFYNNGYYVFIKTESGTYYYQKSILPNEIKLIRQGASCYPDWYLSGSKYAFDKEQVQIPQNIPVCIYKKQ